ncbi:uncharacterized protein A4U43_C04F20840 [Asparagus officinalis]|uniref:GDSL esterase/lipase EXL3 n=1 Tax=Asparagus officinalis TaxID=4686 RepID=A0A5P1F2L0_ASPOF|nr:uncharacterized protein A4U43_C04F20840 [Asparagus officinalis]
MSRDKHLETSKSEIMGSSGKRLRSKSTTVLSPLLLLLLLQIHQTLTLATNETSPKVPALIVFGDSVVDPGNNNAIITTTRCNFPPYGKDFVGHRATGRFSNGKTPSDLFASQLGIKEYLPAYLGTKLSPEELLTGVSFASGGCGYDPQTALLVSALNMTDQLNLFKEYKEKVKIIAGEEKAVDIITKSIYFIATGTDDIANTYFTAQIRKLEYDLPSYIKYLVQQASSFYQELYKSGARKIVILGAPPIGCVPSQRTLAGGIERDCVPLYNEAAMMLNKELAMEIQRLNSTLPGSMLLYIDTYTPLLDMISRPSAYGFKVSSKGCCGTGTFEVTLTCNSWTTNICDDVSEYLFWDTYHPTERAYQILMTKMQQKYGSYFN